MSTSINLTIHNKDFLLERVLNAILENTTGTYELVCVLDGCTDKSEEILFNFIKQHPNLKTSVLFAENVFETKANNMAAKHSTGEHIIIVQDDVVIKEKAWNERLLTPFKMYDDVFGVTGNCAHNWSIVQGSPDLKVENGKYLNDRWAVTIAHVYHAHRNSIERNVFGIRDCVNRAPLALNNSDLRSLGYFDESFIQDCDDHDLCYRMHKKLGKQVGCLWIDYESDNKWGGTRDENGKTKSWLFELFHKNSLTLIERHREEMQIKRLENRIISVI